MRCAIKNMGKVFVYVFLVVWLLPCGTGQARAADAPAGTMQGGSGKIFSGNGPVYSRLIVHNRCYRNIKADIEEYRGYLFYSPRWLGARSTEYFELWPGTKTPRRTYSMKRDGAPDFHNTLEGMLQESEKSTASLGNIFLHEYTYTFCKDEADLGTPGAEFARAAERGERIDVFETFLTQIEGSRKKEFAYRNYPVLFFLDDYPLLYTQSDDEGYLRISLPADTQGRLRVYGTAFAEHEGFVLHKEWVPIRTFTATGGETVYRIPPHKNITGW